MAAAIGGITGGITAGAGKLIQKFRGGATRTTEALKAACGNSFSADTLVSTPDGDKTISSLAVGDQVQAYDPATSQVSTQTVQQVFINHDSDLIDVTLQSDAGPSPTDAITGQTKQQAADIASHGSQAPPSPSQKETVHTTQKHPWLTTKGWIKAGDLQVGDQVQRLDGTTATVVALVVVPGDQDMYDLTVSHIHTFTVGGLSAVVHNITGCGSAHPRLQPYKVGSTNDGHHILAKSAWRTPGKKGKDIPPYNMYKAYVLKNGDIASQGWNHAAMTATQRRLFKAMQRGWIPNTMKYHSRIALKALTRGGVPNDVARHYVAASLRQLRSWGIRRPFRIPLFK